MDDINSITGRDVPHITLTQEDRGRLWSYVYPITALPGALLQRDWLAAAYWVVSILGMTVFLRFGQQQESRTTMHKVVLCLLWSVSTGLVLWPGSDSATTRLVGLAIAPIPFVADVILAHRARG